MMMDYQGWLGVAVVAIAIISAAALAFAYLAGSYSKTRIESLRGELDDSMRREAQKDKQITGLQAQIQTFESRVEHVESENATLRELVLQRIEITALVDEIHGLDAHLEHHNEQVAKYWAKMLTGMGKMNRLQRQLIIMQGGAPDDQGRDDDDE